MPSSAAKENNVASKVPSAAPIAKTKTIKLAKPQEKLMDVSFENNVCAVRNRFLFK